MLEFKIYPELAIDEADRHLGMSDANLAVTVTATQSPQIDHRPILSRYWFRAQLMGYGREGNPTRSNARQLAKFGRRITMREPRFNFGTGRFEFVVVERILEQHQLRFVEQPAGHRAVFMGHSSLTVEISLLDVSRARPFQFEGQTIRARPPEAAEVIFARVDLIDGDNDDAIVLTKDSNPISEFFGADERTSVGGENREFPRFPVTFTPFALP